ncbi:MAG: alpha/beta hydrolase [Flavobacteriales bacterium]|nr:alpha/beta hydrolase [Flavobacteriales bacterium]
MKIAIRLILIGLVGLVCGFIASSWHDDIPVEEIIEKYAYDNSQFVELDGMQVHYRINGDTGETVVLLHGTASSLHTWEGWTNELSKYYRVVSFDMPGFGITGPEPNDNYTRERYQKFIEDVLLKLNVDTCYMAGNSFGGYMAWSFAVNHPDKVKKLAVLNSSGYPRGDQPTPVSFKLQKMDWMKPVLLHLTPQSLVRKSVKVVYFDDWKITEELVERYHELLLREGNRAGLMGKTRQINYDHSEEVKQIKCPTLIMWGDSDGLVNVEAAAKFHADIPNSELLIYENMGHVPMEEIPERSVADFISFLRK